MTLIAIHLTTFLYPRFPQGQIKRHEALAKVKKGLVSTNRLSTLIDHAAPTSSSYIFQLLHSHKSLHLLVAVFLINITGEVKHILKSTLTLISHEIANKL